VTVRKSGSGYRVVHCHGKRKGKTIAKHRTKRAAERQHRAIQASKRRRK
jgi:hypothetical protein